MAHDLFGDAFGIDLSVVEEVDAGIKGRMHALFGEIPVHLCSESHPGTERQS